MMALFGLLHCLTCMKCSLGLLFGIQSLMLIKFSLATTLAMPRTLRKVPACSSFGLTIEGKIPGVRKDYNLLVFYNLLVLCTLS